MKKLLTLLLFVALSFSVVACGDNKEEDNKSGNEEPTQGEVVETPNEVVKVRPDNREEKYIVYEADKTEVERFASLYAAIIYCVDNCDLDAYVTTQGASDKLFINAELFNNDLKDMFWYYSEGTTLSEYSAWKSDYWTDYVKDEDYICVFKNYATQQLESHANSYKLVSLGESDEAKVMPVYRSCWNIEASVTVDLIAYSGITKGVYNVALSQAKVYPSYEGSDSTWAYVGFITADSNNVSNQGIMCDTTNGNWYYYSGETTYNTNEVKIDDSKLIMTSTWDDTKKCFVPDHDVTLTMELLTLADTDGDEYKAHRLTVLLDNGTSKSFDYELSTLTQCGTVRFTCGLDIVTDNTFADYMNGAKFENVVITSAKGYVLEEIADGTIDYGNFPSLDAGEYDLLNSNAASAARFQTVIYTPSCVTYDFNTPGKDVYSFSYDF